MEVCYLNARLFRLMENVTIESKAAAPLVGSENLDRSEASGLEFVRVLALFLDQIMDDYHSQPLALSLRCALLRYVVRCWALTLFPIYEARHVFTYLLRSSIHVPFSFTFT